MAFFLSLTGYLSYAPAGFQMFSKLFEQAIDEGRNVPIFKASDYQAYQVLLEAFTFSAFDRLPKDNLNRCL